MGLVVWTNVPRGTFREWECRAAGFRRGGLNVPRGTFWEWEGGGEWMGEFSIAACPRKNTSVSQGLLRPVRLCGAQFGLFTAEPGERREAGSGPTREVCFPELFSDRLPKDHRSAAPPPAELASFDSAIVPRGTIRDLRSRCCGRWVIRRFPRSHRPTLPQAPKRRASG